MTEEEQKELKTFDTKPIWGLSLAQKNRYIQLLKKQMREVQKDLSFMEDHQVFVTHEAP